MLCRHKSSNIYQQQHRSLHTKILCHTKRPVTLWNITFNYTVSERKGRLCYLNNRGKRVTNKTMKVDDASKKNTLNSFLNRSSTTIDRNSSFIKSNISLFLLPMLNSWWFPYFISDRLVTPNWIAIASFVTSWHKERHKLWENTCKI